MLREGEGGRRGGDVFPLQSSGVQCVSVPVLVTMLHFTSSQIISLFSLARDQPGGPHSVAAFRPQSSQSEYKTWLIVAKGERGE